MELPVVDYSKAVLGFVLYNPEGLVFIESIKSVAAAGFCVIVFDNSNEESIRETNRSLLLACGVSDVTYLCDDGNVGLSAAYNRITDFARVACPDFLSITFFDQDSAVTGELIGRLYKNYLSVKDKMSIGVYSAYALGYNNEPYRIRVVGVVPNRSDLLLTKLAPSSFSMITRSALDRIGSFYDDFFIDHIDVDFCQRCRRANLVIVVDTTVTFHHFIGNGDVTFFGVRLMPLSNPYRVYYQVRNIILSNGRKGATFGFMFAQLIRRLVAITITGLKYRDLAIRLKFYARGLLDGVLGRAGQLKI